MPARKVTQIRTHDSLFATGWGTLENSLPPKTKTFPGLLMVEGENGVEVSAPGKVSFVVPYAHIKAYELAPEAPAPVKGK